MSLPKGITKSKFIANNKSNGYKEIINKNSTWKSLNVNNTKEHITSDIIIDINNSYYLLKLSQNRLIDNNCYSYQEPKIIKLIAFDGHI